MHIISSSHLTLSRRRRRRSPRTRSPRWRCRRRPPLQQQLQLLVPRCRRRGRRYWSGTCRVVRRCTFCLALLCWSARCGSRSRSPLGEEVVESPTLVRRTAAAAAAAAPCGTGIHHGKANANRRLRPSQNNDLASKRASRPNSKRTRRAFCRCSVPKRKRRYETKQTRATTVPLSSCIKGKHLSFAYPLARSSRRLFFGVDSRKDRFDFSRLASRHLLGSFFQILCCCRRHHLS